MNTEKAIFTFDPSDINGMLKLMEQYGDSEMPFAGKNEDGEDILISISKNQITVRTMQRNGWCRKNIYTSYEGGDFTAEELFEK